MRKKRHGMSLTSIHNIWRQMRKRCLNPNDATYDRYGGRGIKVCKRWDKFENFLKDMGDRPKGLSIDRIDNNKGYSPKNCRWATPLEQSSNMRSNNKFLFNGNLLHLAEIARLTGIKYRTLGTRLKRGLPIKKAIQKIDYRKKDTNETTNREE